MNNSVIEITWTGIVYSLLPLLAVGWFFLSWLKDAKQVAVATFRMVFQLFLMGYALIYIFNNDSVWVGVIIIVIVTLIASWIGIRSLKNKSLRRYGVIVLALSLSCGFMLFYILYGVIGLEPLYQPRYFIPLAGMIFVNAMNSVSLAGERYDNECANGKTHLEARNNAFRASMIPQINAFFAVGLVSLPGMMTGQILAGVEPVLAIRYQIVVMAMILGSAGMAVVLFLKMQKHV